jgi:hypothetical protein
MSEAMRAWIHQLDSYPGGREWKRKHISHTLHFDDPFLSDALENEFVFSAEIEKKHTVIFQYVGLECTVQSLKDCEHYFRRYPFRKSEVSRHDDITNVCEM